MDNKTKEFDYIKEAHATCSDAFYGERVSVKHFAVLLDNAIIALNELDKIKKTIFYGKDLGVPMPGKDCKCVSCLENANDLVEAIANQDEFFCIKNALHGILGKATEAGELLEVITSFIHEGKEFDLTNIIEEVGDGLWYDAILLKAIGSNFGEAQAINIAKLRKRFPNAFSEYDANNRNLDEERKILEKALDAN